MPLGPIVRRMFGSREHKIAELYRSFYVDLDAYAECIYRWVPEANKILEVGCGEGAVTERLAHFYPQAEITAIDITPNVGRLYRGPTGHVKFAETTVQKVAIRTPEEFDLVLLSDVIHHVPVQSRNGLISAVRCCVAPGGRVVFKDWEKRFSPIHWLCVASDRFLTGDRVHYMTVPNARTFLTDAFGEGAIEREALVRPWRNNYAFLLHV